MKTRGWTRRFMNAEYWRSSCSRARVHGSPHLRFPDWLIRPGTTHRKFCGLRRQLKTMRGCGVFFEAMNKILALAIVFVCAASYGGQQQPYTVSVNVDVVLTNVRVTDRDGQPVRGLDAS